MMVAGGVDGGLEDEFGFLVGDAVAFEHLTYGRVVFGEDSVVGEGGGEVHVADLPAVVSSLFFALKGNFQYRLGELVDDVDFLAGLMEGSAVGERMAEIEAEIGTVSSFRAVAAFSEGATVDLKRDDFFVGGDVVEMSGDELHGISSNENTGCEAGLGD